MSFKFNRYQSEHIEIKRRLRTAQQHERDSLLLVQGENIAAWKKACKSNFQWKAELREAQFWGLEKESMDPRDYEAVLVSIEALKACDRGESPDPEAILQKVRKSGVLA